MDIEKLMQPGNTRWEDSASCRGDQRFINPMFKHLLELSVICHGCPVFDDCDSWANGRSGVFAAGYWREGGERVEDWHGKADGHVG